MWKLFFNKKEKKMPATKNPNNDVKKLTEVVQKQKRTIGTLQDRISNMSDQLSMVSSDLRKLREDVSEDLKTLFNKIES